MKHRTGDSMSCLQVGTLTARCDVLLDRAWVLESESVPPAGMKAEDVGVFIVWISSRSKKLLRRSWKWYSHLDKRFSVSGCRNTAYEVIFQLLCHFQKLYKGISRWMERQSTGEQSSYFHASDGGVCSASCLSGIFLVRQESSSSYHVILYNGVHCRMRTVFRHVNDAVTVSYKKRIGFGIESHIVIL